jgi:hypothetical protein
MYGLPRTALLLDEKEASARGYQRWNAVVVDPPKEMFG